MNMAELAHFVREDYDSETVYSQPRSSRPSRRSYFCDRDYSGRSRTRLKSNYKGMVRLDWLDTDVASDLQSFNKQWRKRLEA